MIIELWRKLVATEYSMCCCVICGNGFNRGTVFAVAAGDTGQDLGELCDVCLEYLGRRKEDAKDPALANWPAREWPTVEDLEEARRRYPFAMFATNEELGAAATDPEADDRIYEASVVWRMEPESTPA